KPRAESWAGLLFGALFLLAYVKVSVPSMFGVVGRFALYGLAAGGIGFGGGALWMVLSSRVDTLAWLPYWKFMEFSFGFCFGAGLGLCAWHLRRGLPHYAPLVDPHAQAKSAGLAAGAVLVGVFLLWPLLVVGILPWLVTPLGRTLLGYTGLGCVLLGLARSSPTLAWQIAATVTFIATTIDLRADLFPGSGAAVTVTLWGFVLLLGVVAAVLVLQWQRRAGERLVPLFVSLLWALMAVAYLRGISTSPAWNASSGAEAFQQIRAELIVHGIFTLFAILSTWGAVRFHEAAKHRT
ncbi:MAG: hypothetical protein HYV26_04805, partial [Candidatus Hydrogenedentes bacterium]|nr:hypothetical protein [Candidatus Hydrogenedentota bacterium]